MITSNTETAETRQITFHVVTDVPLPVGEQVFITGNQPALGNWDPGGFPLTRVDDRSWSGTLPLPAETKIEYKITRGSWKTEEILEDATLPENKVIDAGSNYTAHHTVAQWRDEGPAPVPQITGDYRVHEGFHSRYLRFDRKVIVWLPPSYDKEPERRYPVLYMQDGQQVFDPQTSTWKQDWQVDEWCTQLIGEFRLQEIIVVAIYSTEDRFLEYNPSMAGHEYSRFILEELKPFIDSEYRTRPERETTAVAGSSMGGTISFFLAWTHPDVFFGAACLSPAFRFRNDQYDLDLVRKTPETPRLRLFLYCGEGDPTEKELLSGTQEMRDLLRERGYNEGSDLVATVDQDGQHNEASWALHSDDWLLFLFGK